MNDASTPSGASPLSGPPPRISPADASAFIQAETRLRPVPHAPEITLHLADEATALWQRTEEELQEIGLPPPFWAFAWAGGQALARYLLDNPGLVAGRRVLDFASGSGLVAIAAARAGATHVRASDLDPFAIASVGLNAAANGVADLIEAAASYLIGSALEADLVLAADIFYEQDLAGRVGDWLGRLHAGGTTVLLGDPGRAYLPKSGLCERARYEVPTSRELEDRECRECIVWEVLPG